MTERDRATSSERYQFAKATTPSSKHFYPINIRLKSERKLLSPRGTKLLLNWQNFRRFYLYIMTENMKNIILRHRTVLLSDENKNRHKLNEHEIISAATLPELDDAYTRKVHNFKTISELYSWSSSINYLNNINVPMMFINSLDDPIIPEKLLDPIRKFAGSL